MVLYRAEILSLRGSFGSGMASLTVKLPNGSTRVIHGDNGPLIRALDQAYDIIGPGHTVDPSNLTGQVIYYWLDDMGLCIGGFIPESDFDRDMFLDKGYTIEE
jgi:hypothetical protein